VSGDTINGIGAGSASSSGGRGADDDGRQDARIGAHYNGSMRSSPRSALSRSLP
jgi:hypothetical protein